MESNMTNRRDFIKSIPTALGAAALVHEVFLPSAAEALPVDDKGEYLLPALPYDYNALEPHIDEQTMRLHHDKHHAAYVKGLNDSLAKLKTARESGDFGLVQTFSGKVAFNGSGHILHTIFWKNMSQTGGGKPTGALAKAIEDNFGSYEGFKGHFSAAAVQVEGSGWGVLAYEPLGKKLMVLQAEKHQNLTAWGVTPLLVVDVWEHAYYLKYQNRRADYVSAFFNVISWSDVAGRLTAASQ